MTDDRVGAGLNSSGDYGEDFEDLMEESKSEERMDATDHALQATSTPLENAFGTQDTPSALAEQGTTDATEPLTVDAEGSSQSHVSDHMAPVTSMQPVHVSSMQHMPAAPSSQGTILQQVAAQPLNYTRESSEPSSAPQPASTAGAAAWAQQSHGSIGFVLQGDRQRDRQHSIAAVGLDAGSDPGHTEADESEQHGQSQPHFSRPTAVNPKPPGDEYRNAEHQAVMLAFSTGTLSGIRSLPNALEPGFRARLYDAMVQQHVADREAARAQSADASCEGGDAQPRLAYGLVAGPPVASGQRAVPRVHPYSGAFTWYEYMPSEYDRGRLMGKFEKLKGKLAQVAPLEFVVKATPAGPKGAPAFSEFEYANDPFVTMSKLRQAEDVAARSSSLAGPFVTGGRVVAQALLRGRADECMMALCRLLSADWPTAFLQVFEDRSGAVVVSFDRRRALAEGDLPTYMQNLVKSHWLVAEYSLVKDGTQWGLVDDETQSVFYLMWPPWVRHRFVGPLPSGVGQGGQGVEGSQGSASSEPSSPSRGAKSAGSGVMSEASLQRQAVLSSDFAKMGALSRSAAQVKPPTTAGVSAGAAGQGAGVARSVGLPSRSNTGVAVA